MKVINKDKMVIRFNRRNVKYYIRLIYHKHPIYYVISTLDG
jgi:hypothetical protein